jgi:hypothetical protein
VNLPIFTKRLSFAHESEVRVVLVSSSHALPPKAPVGLPVSVKLDTLIEDVYVSPLSANWVKNAVQDVLVKYALNRTVRRSTLANEPYFWPD